MEHVLSWRMYLLAFYDALLVEMFAMGNDLHWWVTYHCAFADYSAQVLFRSQWCCICLSELGKGRGKDNLPRVSSASFRPEIQWRFSRATHSCEFFKISIGVVVAQCAEFNYKWIKNNMTYLFTDFRLNAFIVTKIYSRRRIRWVQTRPVCPHWRMRLARVSKVSIWVSVHW